MPRGAGYTAYIETDGASTGRAFENLAGPLDQALASLNIEYEFQTRQRSAQALAPRGLLADGTERAYRRHCVGKGQREAQFKVLTLQNADEFDFDFTPHLISDASR